MTLPSELSTQRSPSIVKRLGVFLGLGALIAAAIVLVGSVISDGSPGSAPAAASVSGEEPGDFDYRGLLPELAGLAGDSDESSGLHGEFSLPRESGGSELLAWQLGEISAKTGDRITVRGKGDVTWNWKLDEATEIHSGADGTKADLKKGRTVYVLGTRNGEVRTADHIAAPDSTALEDGKPLLELPDSCTRNEKPNGLLVTCESHEEQRPAPKTSETPRRGAHEEPAAIRM